MWCVGGCCTRSAGVQLLLSFCCALFLFQVCFAPVAFFVTCGALFFVVFLYPPLLLPLSLCLSSKAIFLLCWTCVCVWQRWRQSARFADIESRRGCFVVCLFSNFFGHAVMEVVVLLFWCVRLVFVCAGLVHFGSQGTGISCSKAVSPCFLRTIKGKASLKRGLSFGQLLSNRAGVPG